jgi:hypothetical protein
LKVSDILDKGAARCETSGMGERVSCPRCDVPVTMGEPVCPGCGFTLVEERRASRGAYALLARLRRFARPSAPIVAAAAAVAAVLALVSPHAGREPPSEPLSAREAERRLAVHYPRLREAEHAVIACPDRRIEPGGEARCWILARVGFQRSVVVRLSARGNAVHIED